YTCREFDVGGDAMVAFSPDGRWLVAGTGEGYRFWEVNGWQPSLTLPADQMGDVARPLAFRPDGKVLAIAPTPWTIRLVAPGTGQELATLTTPGAGIITWLCFSPDGSRLAAAGANRVVYLWDVGKVGAQLAELGLAWGAPL